MIVKLSKAQEAALLEVIRITRAGSLPVASWRDEREQHDLARRYGVNLGRRRGTSAQRRTLDALAQRGLLERLVTPVGGIDLTHWAPTAQGLEVASPLLASESARAYEAELLKAARRVEHDLRDLPAFDGNPADLHPAARRAQGVLTMLYREASTTSRNLALALGEEGE